MTEPSSERELLLALTRPFPSNLILTAPQGGGSYVNHAVIRQRLLDVFGLYDFSLVEVLRGHVDGIPPNPKGNSSKAKRGSPALEDVVVGAVCTLTVTRADGRSVSVTDVGDVGQPHNWATDGARMKDAMSDALKRCAMGIGVGLHLWCKPGQFLVYGKLHTELTPDEPAVAALELGDEIDAPPDDLLDPVEPPAEDAPSPEEPPSDRQLEAPVEMVERRDANRELLAAYQALGLGDDDAKVEVAAAWKFRGIGNGPVPRELLDAVVASVAVGSCRECGSGDGAHVPACPAAPF